VVHWLLLLLLLLLTLLLLQIIRNPLLLWLPSCCVRSSAS
jgi:hypothetical protein